jgi:hypothetical protein
MRNVIVFLAGAVALNGCAPGTPRPGSAPPVAAAEAFVDAFYSFDAERLKEALAAAPESQPRIMYYQGWAQGGNYVVVRRMPCRAESPERVVCSITVKDDLIQAMGTGFDVTDTFHLGISGGKIVSVRTTSNDPPEFDQAMKWVERERPGLVEVPCRDAFEGGPTPQACVRAMVQGFREFAALGRPAPADTPSSALPLRDTRALVVVDAWQGYPPISPGPVPPFRTRERRSR